MGKYALDKESLTRMVGCSASQLVNYPSDASDARSAHIDDSDAPQTRQVLRGVIQNDGKVEMEFHVHFSVRLDGRPLGDFCAIFNLADRQGIFDRELNGAQDAVASTLGLCSDDVHCAVFISDIQSVNIDEGNRLPWLTFESLKRLQVVDDCPCPITHTANLVQSTCV